MADPRKAGDGVEVDAGTNPELAAWTSTLFKHFLEDSTIEALECEVDGVKYDVSISSLEDAGTQFVSMTRQDGLEDEIFFFVNDDNTALNTFVESEDNGLSFIKKVCAQLGVSLSAPQTTALGVAAKVVETL